MTEFQTKEDVKFSDKGQAEITRILKQYPEGRQKSALLPILHIAQAEFGGWVSPVVMDKIAEILNIQPIEVYEVATFYTMFNLDKVGKHVLEVCRTGPCMLRGSDELIEKLENTLACKVGETSADGMFTLKTVECLASCGTGPMMQVRERYIENLSVENIELVLNELRNS